MKTLLITILISCFTYGQKDVDLKLTNKNPFKFKEAFKVMDEEEGFYDEVIARSAPDGTIYIYDKGNKLCFKYDKDGKHLLTFGKEGNGPGEFSQFVADFYASNERLIFKNFAAQVVMLFDTKGKFIKDMKGNQIILSQPLMNSESLTFLFPRTQYTKLLKVVYDLDGNEIEKVENKELVEGSLQKLYSGEASDNDMKEAMKSPRSFMPFNGGYMQHYAGAYSMDFLDKNLITKKSYHYAFTRIKIKDVMDLVPRGQKKFLDKIPEAQKKAMFQRLNAVAKSLGGYHPDIVDILGTYKDFIFIQVKSTRNDELAMHIISNKDELVQIAKIDCDEITSAKVTNGLLLVNQTNEEDGPFTSVYKL